MQRILLLDNYDSFTYNLAHYISGADVLVDVVLNDEIDCSKIGGYDKIVLSPGPGLPNESGKLMEVIERCANNKPVLGVCLGMQAMASFLGGELYNQEQVKHGVSESIELQDSLIFKGLPPAIDVGLYHSWAAFEKGNFRVTAKSDSGVVMAIENSDLRFYGVQFHPESILTEHGKQIITNFLNG